VFPVDVPFADAGRASAPYEVLLAMRMLTLSFLQVYQRIGKRAQAL
jgi:hypothetical protein